MELATRRICKNYILNPASAMWNFASSILGVRASRVDFYIVPV